MGEVAGLYYEEHGPAGAPPVILSAGLGGSGSYWAPNLDALAREHRVILYDHRGTGRSDRTLQPELGIDEMADDLWRLINYLNVLGATLVGHALGGIIGLCVARRAPNLVRRLVVVNGFSRPDPYFTRCLEVRLELLNNSGVEAFLLAQPIFLYPAQWISDHDRELREQAREQLHDFQGVDNLEARVDALCRVDIGNRLEGIVAPTLLVAAKDDMLVPASCSAMMAATLPCATLVTMSGGHACNITEPDVFNTILLDWLSGEHLKGAA